mmetsp:Transcript_988/g.3012  ORF Transcript_988/g.3012 Transcript_988/m.3012 type:complete len:202 (-) Transcript_988:806-1411(-)
MWHLGQGCHQPLPQEMRRHRPSGRRRRESRRHRPRRARAHGPHGRWHRTPVGSTASSDRSQGRPQAGGGSTGVSWRGRTPWWHALASWLEGLHPRRHRHRRPHRASRVHIQLLETPGSGRRQRAPRNGLEALPELCHAGDRALAGHMRRRRHRGRLTAFGPAVHVERRRRRWRATGPGGVVVRPDWKLCFARCQLALVGEE